jgi:Rieske 2Fe-2S family protein
MAHDDGAEARAMGADAAPPTRPDGRWARLAPLFGARRPGYSLPQALYNDPALFDFDMEAIFARSWLLVGFEAELDRPGAYISTKIGRWPVLIVRDRAARVRAFHNTCRHRGSALCPEGKGTTARLVCPYHRWTYELSGELVSAPRMPADFDPALHALRPVALEAIAGALYVCLAETPPAIDAFAASLGSMLTPHGLAGAKLAYENTLVEDANWKLVMENARECYHCPRAHPELSRAFPTGVSAYFDYGEDPRPAQFNKRMAELGLPVGPAEESWWQAMRFPLNEDCVSMTMDGRHCVRRLMVEAGGGDVGSLRWATEPNSFCHAAGDFVFAFTAMPLGPRQTLVSAKWLVRGDAVEGVDYDLSALTRLWDITNRQDKELAENNQRGVDSLGYRPGPYSPEAEALTIRFANWYCETAQAYLEAGR